MAVLNSLFKDIVSFGDPMGGMSQRQIDILKQVPTGPVEIKKSDMVQNDLIKAKPVESVNLKMGENPVLDQLEKTTEDLVAKFLRDRLDIVKIVAGGGTSGNTVLDSAIRGALSAVKTEAVNQNQKYWLPVFILGLVFALKKFIIK
ncbi:MAG: hypothetical protein JNL75_11170 [Chitinophagales bacterium]|nr:hypothetical protein [Chitinophagales bacterium]